MKKQWKQFEVLKWASLFLEENNCEKRVAEILLQHYLNVTQARFYMQMRDEVPEGVVTSFRNAIFQHVETGVPVQHLTGYEYFYGRKFSVNEHTLIPRPETEELVQRIIEEISEFRNPIIADIGTGSGVIAITLALEIPEVSVIATDISTSALTVAKENARAHDANVTFLTGDYIQPLIKEGIVANVIVSNPPYISYQDKMTLSRTVKNFDPALALFAEDHGLRAYKTLLDRVETSLVENGVFFFEIGFDQADAIKGLFSDKFPHGKVEVFQDINGNDRIIKGKLKA